MTVQGKIMTKLTVHVDDGGCHHRRVHAVCIGSADYLGHHQVPREVLEHHVADGRVPNPRGVGGRDGTFFDLPIQQRRGRT